MTFKNFIQEYKKNTKEFRLEEPLDFILFRPLAYILVKSIYQLPLNPNHISLLGLLSSFTAAYFLMLGTADGFYFAGFCILVFCVLDCADGMLARMKNNASKYGELIDMFVDLLSSAAIFTGLFLGLRESNSYIPFVEYLAWLTGVCLFVHVSVYNYYKTQLQDYSQNNPEARKKKLTQTKRELESFRKSGGNYFNRFLLRLFIVFIHVQKNNKKLVRYKPDKYVEYNKNILPMWALISGSTHLFILALALIFHRVGIYFFFGLILANMWMTLVFFIQMGMNSSLGEELP